MLQPCPPNFQEHVHSFSFTIPAPAASVWSWLNDTKTFTDTQVWPYKVEFYSPDPEKISDGFNEGVLTNHTGPFVNFAGQLVSIDENYRDLQYYYGSFAISFGWIRPFRLQFWTKQESEEQTQLSCSIGVYVKPYISSIWSSAQKMFWKRFQKWAIKSVVRHHHTTQHR